MVNIIFGEDSKVEAFTVTIDNSKFQLERFLREKKPHKWEVVMAVPLTPNTVHYVVVYI